MTDAIVGVLVEKLNTLVVENAKLVRGAKGDIEGLMSDLGMLKAFLVDAEEKTREFQVVKQLVVKIRDLIFDIEDAIDAFEVEAKGFKAKPWLKKVFSGVSHTAMLRSAAKTAQTLKVNIEDIRKDQAYGLALKRGGHDTIKERKPQPVVEEDNVVGFDGPATEVIERLTTGSKELEVVSIIGMPGLGKTTLAKKVFKDPRVAEAFNATAWIFVSQEFNKTDLLVEILKSGHEEVKNPTDEESLVKQVREYYLDWKYLIVVDDVWRTEDWDKIKQAFPKNRKGSRILLTSRHNYVALHAEPRIHCPPYELQFLDDDQSWKLLQIRVFGQEECPEEYKDLIPLGRKISKKCGGLPLAVVLVAGMLQAKKFNHSWEAVAASVNARVMDEEECKKVLALSYDQLQPHLRLCFLYFGVSPVDNEVPVWILIRLWIAERFVQRVDGVSGEKMAEDHLEDLAARNLVLVVKRSLTGRIKTCRIHDIMRDFCLKKAEEEAFLVEIKEGGKSKVGRRLCIHSGVKDFISSKPCGHRVRSFLSFAKNKVNLPEELEGCIPDDFKLLRVYHILPIVSTRFPAEITKLVFLTYVAFSGEFTSIPAAMSSLSDLQTLIAKTTSRTNTIAIHADILKMSQFRHLHTNKACQLSIAKSSRTSNKSIQTLSTITPESCTEEFLGQTPSVNKLGIRGKLATLIEGNGRSPFDNLTQLKQVVTLKLFNDVSPSCPFVSKLSLPMPAKFPPNLQRLTLADSYLDWRWMDVLGTLPELEELKLKDYAFTGESWTVVDGADGTPFKKLRALQIGKTDLKYWKAEANHFPSLQHIFLVKCAKLGDIPSSLGKVKTIKLHRTSRDAAASVRKIRETYPGLKVDFIPTDLGQA